MDDKLTVRIQEWLETPAQERDVPAGASMLLSLNRNRVLFQNIIRRPDKMAPKLEYELKKHLRIRLDGMTRRDVVRMSAEVMPAAKETVEKYSAVPEAVHVGKREDHDSLPDEIKALYEAQADLYHRIKQTYNTLVAMEDAPACDRYELLKMLKEQDVSFRNNWRRYDEAEPVQNIAAEDNEASGEVEDEADKGTESEDEVEKIPVPSAKEVAAARKFISTNSQAVAALEGEEKERMMAALQERVDLVIRSGGSFKPDFRDKLIDIGLVIG